MQQCQLFIESEPLQSQIGALLRGTAGIHPRSVMVLSRGNGYRREESKEPQGRREEGKNQTCNSACFSKKYFAREGWQSSSGPQF